MVYKEIGDWKDLGKKEVVFPKPSRCEKGKSEEKKTSQRMFLFQEEEESRMPTPLDFYNRPLMDTFVSTLATLIPEGSFLTKENPSLNALCVPHYPHDKA